MPAPATPPAPAKRPIPAHEHLGGRMLIIDDEGVNRLYLRQLLSVRGCEILEAQDGKSGLELARAHMPDLILVDLMMPGMSGHDLCRAVKADERLHEIPVIIVTARSGIEDIEQGFLLGASDYIRKPFNVRELVMRVRTALLVKRSADEVRLWKQRTTRELEMAGALQRRMLSAHPLLSEHFECYSAFYPAMNIGGDVFDIIRLPDGGLAAYVGDVSGHGVGPAMISLMFKAMLSDLIGTNAKLGPAAICNELNFRFRRQLDNPEVYATLFLALYRPERQAWQCMNCGHPPPFVFPSRGAMSIQLPDVGGMPVGLADGASYRPEDELLIPAPPGTLLFFYTDGISEARANYNDEPLDGERLCQMVHEQLSEGFTVNVPELILTRTWAAGYALDVDDCTALLVEHIPTDDLRVSRSFVPSHQAVDELAQACEADLLASGWPDEAAMAVRLVVTEHGCNVVDHARLPAGSTVTFFMRVTGKVARLLFRDTGRDWEEICQRDWRIQCPSDAEHGRGLGIIQAAAFYRETFRRGHENISSYLVSADFKIPAEQGGGRA